MNHVTKLSLVTVLLLLGKTAAYAGSENDGYFNVFYGLGAGSSLDSTSESNTFVGYGSGNKTKGGDTNVFSGTGSGYYNTTGSRNI